MPATIGVTWQGILSAVHTVTGTFISSGDATLTTALSSESLVLNAGTTPPVTKIASGSKALSSGSGTLDLTSLPGLTADETVTMLGLKVQFLILRNKSTNANVMTVSKGASNGYGLNAAGGSWSIPLDPNAIAIYRIPDSAPDVASGARTIDIAGTGSQELEYIVVAG